MPYHEDLGHTHACCAPPWGRVSGSCCTAWFTHHSSHCFGTWRTRGAARHSVPFARLRSCIPVYRLHVQCRSRSAWCLVAGWQYRSAANHVGHAALASCCHDSLQPLSFPKPQDRQSTGTLTTDTFTERAPAARPDASFLGLPDFTGSNTPCPAWVHKLYRGQWAPPTAHSPTRPQLVKLPSCGQPRALGCTAAEIACDICTPKGLSWLTQQGPVPSFKGNGVRVMGTAPV